MACSNDAGEKLAGRAARMGIAELKAQAVIAMRGNFNRLRRMAEIRRPLARQIED